ncbi:MAG: substrate-binding domain-containing protein [Bacteroidota bacterium]
MNKEKLTRLTGFFFVFFLALLTGCGSSNIGGIDTPTSGKIKVGVDDSYKLMMDAELYTFQALYKYAKIDTVVGNEADIVDLFLKDSLPLIITNRKLTTDEEKALNSRQIIPKTTKIAYDALAFIVNRDNADSNIYYDQIKEIFNGKITNWKQINPKRDAKDSIKVVFDHFKSGNPRYFKERFNLTKLPSVCFAAQNNSEVIRFVEKNKNAIGVISVNWISDKADTVSHGFLKRIKVVNVSAPGNNIPEGPFYWPHPGYIAQGDYPFTREVYCINRQTYTGLAYGFSAFIAGDKGQLIIYHCGMVPATQPVRLVQIKN